MGGGGLIPCAQLKGEKNDQSTQGKNVSRASEGKVGKKEKERTKEVKNLAYNEYAQNTNEPDPSAKPNKSNTSVPGHKRYIEFTRTVSGWKAL